MLRVKGLSNASEQILRELIAQSPAWPTPRTMLVVALRERGAFDEAAEVLEDALRRSPKNVPLRLERARLLYARGAKEEAFEAALALSRDSFADEPTYNALCAMARALGRTSDVEALVREQIAENDTRPLGYVRLARLLPRERLEERIDALRAALDRAPRDQQAADDLASALAEAGRLRRCPRRLRLAGSDADGAARTPGLDSRAPRPAGAGRVGDARGARGRPRLFVGAPHAL